jgi:zinc/manganese transport system ATP-binding protein
VITSFEVEGVSVSFNGETILDNLSFSVEPGELLAIIGRNGAGKSTLLKVILGLIKTYRGTVKLTGQKHRPVIGYVPQSRTIDEEMPISTWDFVSLGLPHLIRPWLNKKDRERIKQVLKLTNTEHLAQKAIGKLSGGERQRVFLAQALVKAPDVLLLDESTSNLDVGAQEQMTLLVEKIAKDQQVSVLFISHDLQLVNRFANRVLFLNRHGYKLGPVHELFGSELLKEMYSQIELDPLSESSIV